MPSALNLTTAARKFEEFRNYLSVAYRVVWDAFRREQQEREQGFQECLRFCSDKRDALADQQTYVITFKTPRQMDCEDLYDRLREINPLTTVLNDE